MNTSSNDLTDITRTMLVILFIGGLIAFSFLVIRPFAASTVWAATLVLVILAVTHTLFQHWMARAPVSGSQEQWSNP